MPFTAKQKTILTESRPVMPKEKQTARTQQPFHICSTQLGDNLVHTITFLCHLKESFLNVRPHTGFSHSYWTNFRGRRVQPGGV